ncbi:hypothetical protein TanjilG_24163 [Lupinus angustifolius]|uniref:Uncharacterized protein n=1 Tax=Lupinus angustifolius TaxID=3871 RepID=A0A1J7GUH4_LUPAN|nr:hypothetical protein TanjilG_24163 [Lupinus angustifolius]
MFPTPSDSVTPALSYVTGFDGLIGASRMSVFPQVNNKYHEVAPFSPQGNSGLCL